MHLASNRRPITFLAEIDPEHLIVNSNGDLRSAALVIFDEEDEVVERMRAGYVCAKCFDEQEKPFPKQCITCKFPMSERQAEYVAKNFSGSTFVGQPATQDQEDAVMAEWAEKQAREARDEILRPSQILLPGKDF